MEKWKPIKGYEGIYEVSNLGRVKSLSRKSSRGYRLKEKIILGGTNSSGYTVIVLRKNNTPKSFRLNIIVAVAFLNHNQNKSNLVVDHKNRIRTDNRLDNLRLITNRENTNKKHIISSSKYVGVSKNGNGFISRIIFNKKSIYLGYFKNEIDAHNAYQIKLNEINSKAD